jgi:DNA invertase Pin-like site-specific DNA recombinase
MEKLFVSYYRVSTKEQESSGLGLEAQRRVVENYIKTNGNKIIAEYTEVESGRNNNRPELLKAIQQCKEKNATLVIAKLDRLSRSLTLISTLMDTKVRFLCVDLPGANEEMIGFMAVIAQHEAKLIRERTKQALDAKTEKDPDWWRRTHGHVMNNLTEEGRQRAHETVRRNARTDENTRKAYHYILLLKQEGKSYRAIAGSLNRENYKTRRGKQFTAAQVRSIWNRFTK